MMRTGELSFGWRRAVVVAFIICGLGGGLGYADAAQEEGTGPETHAVFVGLDLTYAHGGRTSRVVHVARNRIDVRDDGGTTAVARNAAGELRAKRRPTVSARLVSITALTGAADFNAAHDPARAALVEQSRLDAYQAEREVAAQYGLLNAMTQIPGVEGVPGALTKEGIQRDVDESARKYEAVAASSHRDQLFDPGMRMHQANTRSAAGSFDAYTMTFRIATVEPVEGAYVALLVVVRSPLDPGVPLTALQVEPLPRLTSTARTVAVTREGLPPGFAVERSEIHIFRDGCELASNLSEQALTVSHADAHRFLVLQHVLAHPTGEFPPVVAAELVPAVQPAIAASEGARQLRLTIDADGNVTSCVPVDPDSGFLPGEVMNFVRAMAFLPALREGTPVTDTVSLSLRAML